jgi:hypothetical protein
MKPFDAIGRFHYAPDSHAQEGGPRGAKQTPGRAYADRTRRNARWGDATLWLGNPETPGGKLTLKSVTGPNPIVWPGDSRHDRTPEQVAEWLASPVT